MDRYIDVFGKIRVDRKAITMLYGDGKTGKTTLIYYVMSKVKGKQLFLDIEGGFDIDRFESIIGTKLEEEEIDEVTTIYFNNEFEIEVRDVCTWVELNIILKKRASESTRVDYDLVAIDSLGVLYRDELIDKNDKVQYKNRRLLAKDLGNIFQNIKLMIAKKKGFGIIVNWRTSALETEDARYPFLMGRTADQRPKNIYEFSTIPESDGIREIVVYKAKNLPEGLSVQFRFYDKGMMKV